MAKLALRCASCNYKFSRGAAPNLCPMCGKKSIVEDVQTDAASLLQEVEDMERSMESRKNS